MLFENNISCVDCQMWQRSKGEDPAAAGPNVDGKGGGLGVAENEPQSPGLESSMLSPTKPADVALTLGSDMRESDMSVAYKHLLRTSCTKYDAGEDKFKWRSVRKTSHNELGDYGVGVQFISDTLTQSCIYRALPESVIALIDFPKIN